jgi:ABC-2 type transport system permease protein
MLVGGAVGAALIALTTVLLDLPLRGDIVWVAVGVTVLLAASVGFGLALALASRSDVQAVQFAMLALLASLFFGGFFLELDAFTYPVKFLSWLLPVTYATRLFRDVMLRGDAPALADVAGLVATAVGFAVLSWMTLRGRLRVR